MTSVGVKSVNALFDASVSAKAGVQSDSNTQSFDETLNSMRTEKTDSSKEFETTQVRKGEDKTARFEATGRKNPVKQEEEVTDEQIAAVSEEIISQIKEMIMEKYDITEEQLNVIMEDMSITEEGLLNVAELTKLVMKLEGVESQADMLTNSDFPEKLKEILTKAEEIKSSVKPEDVELKNIMEGRIEEKDVDAATEIAEEAVIEKTVEKTDIEDVEETNSMSEELETVEQTATENTSTSNDDSSETLKHEDDRKTSADVKVVNENNVVQPQDFAKKLTENLSEKVGETKAGDIVRQVVEQTQIHVKQGVTSLEMQLYPEHLGKVLVQVVTQDGNITAKIAAESEAAKNALESQLTLLKDNLNNQGIKVENVEVTIASHAFEQNMQGERNGEQSSEQSRKSRRSTGVFFDEVNDEQAEEAEKEIMELKGSTVSYSA